MQLAASHLAVCWGCSEAPGCTDPECIRGVLLFASICMAILFFLSGNKRVPFPSLLILLETTSERSSDEVLCDSLNATSGGHGHSDQAQSYWGVGNKLCTTNVSVPSPSISFSFFPLSFLMYHLV